ncbi:MAG: Sec-independent protein translocase subunit TatA/TatB [Nitrosopumilaceae archaeon]
MFLANISNFIAGQEWIFVIIIVVVLIFGAKKIPELAKTFGKAKGEFEKGKIEGEKELKDFKESNSEANSKETKSD